MTNYQNELDNYISALDGRKALALHSCCAPCSSYVLEYLTQYFDIRLYFYNPNIHPLAEYERRLGEQHRLCKLMNIELVECEYDSDRYFEYTRGLEQQPEGGKRCEKCFQLRLEHTAALAKADGIRLLGTTLTISPHKNAPLINEIGKAAAEKAGIEWLPGDFKKRNGYKRSIELSREYELYRQNYCGCIYSKTTE